MCGRAHGCECESGTQAWSRIGSSWGRDLRIVDNLGVWNQMAGAGQGQELKTALLPEISREKKHTPSLGFAFLVHDWLSRKFTPIADCPVSTDHGL